MEGAPQIETGRLTLEPIGYARTSVVTKIDAARQPNAARGTTGRIELLAGRNYEHALEDLQNWDYIWVLFWFHLNPSWRPKVLPPRSTTGRKGVFATRSPHRPNPLGLSAVRLDRVDGLTVHLLDVDLLDGTPVLDIKPYVAYTDSHPDAGSGWLEDRASTNVSDGPPDPVAAFDVHFDELATRQADWIEARTGLAIAQRIRSTLALGPVPHPYRRIRRNGDAAQLAVKEWRIRFTVAGRNVRVLELSSGYRPSQLAGAERSASGRDVDLLVAHREFSRAFK